MIEDRYNAGAQALLSCAMRDSAQQDGDLHAVAPGDFVDLTSEPRERWRLAAAARILLWGAIAASAVGIAGFSAWSEAGSQRLQAMLMPATPQPATATPTEPAAALPDTRHAPDEAAAEEIRQLKERLHVLTGEWAGDRTRILGRLEAVERGMDVVASISRQQTSIPDRSKTSRQEGPVDAAGTATAKHPQFAVDLGPAPSVDALRRLWATVSSQHGAVLYGLYPLAAVTDDRRGRAEIRLVAGPLPSATTAVSACAVIGSTGRPCRAARFEGQRIALQ